MMKILSTGLFLFFIFVAMNSATPAIDPHKQESGDLLCEEKSGLEIHDYIKYMDRGTVIATNFSLDTYTLKAMTRSHKIKWETIQLKKREHLGNGFTRLTFENGRVVCHWNQFR